RDLVDEAALRQHAQELGFIGAHEGALAKNPACRFHAGGAVVYQVPRRIQPKERRVELLRAIGLMSGTSLDGVHIALIETDGERIGTFGPTGYQAYAPSERALLRRALAEAAGLTDRPARPGALGEAEALVTQAHAEAVECFLREHRLGGIAVVGFHGQTVLHRPDARLTVQLGDGEALARRLQIPVAYDFRAADVA